jgi:pimeloyl-ACP methyl ester carboxylesterase
MPKVERPGVWINYETLGSASGRPVVLIAGLGEQIGSVEFPEEHCQAFVDAGFRVIRLDNRDCGLSIPDLEYPTRDVAITLAALQSGTPPTPDYILTDMADDVVAVLDDLGLATADVVGASLGGFVARWVGIRHPGRARTLTVVMSGSGAGPSENGAQIDAASVAEMMSMRVRRGRDDAIDHTVGVWRWLWGDRYAFDEPWVRDRAAFAHDRAYRPDGIARALLAGVFTPSFWDLQRDIACPTLIMHGDADPIFGLDHARQVNARIATSQLWVVEGMGHAMHPEHWPQMVRRVAALGG